jgi:alkanesulfonate monooxygenase SsuD/methylene tetrahydromethanopterin reductase-like flavin-dependent oxidoreductase (luciferase family)
VVWDYLRLEPDWNATSLADRPVTRNTDLRPLLQALDLYRPTFIPSAVLRESYAMPGVPVIVAATDAEAQRLLTTPQQRFPALIRNQPVELKPPVDSME